MSHERHGRTHSHPVQDRAGLSRLAGLWWMFLLTGIAWLILSWVALRFNPASVPTVGVLLGVLFLVAMLSEFFIAAVLPSWRWLHVVMGVIFAFGAGRAFARPENAFWTLASILGLLLIFRGTLDIITSASTREVNSAWWLGMVAGILEVLLGFWASQQYLPVRGALLLIWVGFFRPVPRHLRDRERLRVPARPAPLAWVSAASIAGPGPCLISCIHPAAAERVHKSVSHWPVSHSGAVGLIGRPEHDRIRR